jgi:translation initiation factor IF-1
VSRDSDIEIEGIVVDVMPAKGKLVYRVELPNGHRVLGYPRSRRQVLPPLKFGDKVVLAMSPFDFSKGRIVNEKEIL